MSITVYGIPNCDSVKKARTWLGEQQLAFAFHDFKKQGLDAATVSAWLQQQPRELLINKKGTTWRALPEERKAAIVDDASAIALMLELPSVIKRPVLVRDGGVTLGFTPALYQQLFNPT